VAVFLYLPPSLVIVVVQPESLPMTALSPSVFPILSGRTPDANIPYVAAFLAKIGIILREVRIVPDEEGEIVTALNALRERFTYVFTTGGIGPTHDDVTTDAIGKAFSVAGRDRSSRGGGHAQRLHGA
jgi:molybdopterin biosynthesis enzyme MoaB